MRIAYVSLHWPRSVSSSVGQKIERQLSAWQSFGHTTRFFSHLHQPASVSDLLSGDRFPYEVTTGFVGSIATEFSRSGALTELLSAVQEYQPDVIYLRWAMYVYPLHRISRIARIALEVNTNDIQEHRLLGALKSTYNLLTRSLTIRACSGIIFPAYELEHLPAFKRFNKPSLVISNSIDLGAIPELPSPRNNTPHLAFMGTPGYAWHGVEKLVGFAQSFPDVVVDVIGYEHIQGVAEIPANLKLHGYLTGAACDRVLSSADAAIGTLSLHKAGINEASPFKVRDCIARGIPCILPYQDTDLHDLDSPLILSIPNDQNNIADYGQQIHDFVFAVRGRRIPREMVHSRIDFLAKEEQRLRFMESLLSHP